jgi:hypothetical protein
MKKLFLILILNVSLLFSRAPVAGTTDPNGRYVSLNRYAGFFLNPDSYGYIFPAISPRQLMQPFAQRQNRPLYILAGSVMGYSITFLTWPVHGQLQNFYKKFWRGTYPSGRILLTGNFYLGYFILNVSVLWLALYLFERIFYQIVKRTRFSEYVMFLLMVFIASNPVTKAFFWTVHQQMFNLFTPLLCIYFLMSSDRIEKHLSFLQMASVFLLGGFLLLMYGNFILLLPVLVFCFVNHEKKFSKNLVVSVLKAFTVILLFFIPTVFWIWILKLYGVVYSNTEIRDYHQLIWICETLQQSVIIFMQKLLLNTGYFFQTIHQLLILAIFSVVILFSEKIKVSIKSDMMVRMFFVFFCFLLFYWLLGYYSERLTNTLIPVIVCLWLVALGQKITEKKMIFKIGSLVLIWHLNVLISYGPFY